MTNRELAKVLRDKVIGADSVGVNKAGDVVVRREFFYTHGNTADSFTKAIVAQLKNLGIEAAVVESGEVWKAFRGSASVANKSHWFVVLRPIDPMVCKSSIMQTFREHWDGLD
jgi:hypothetical protein